MIKYVFRERPNTIKGKPDAQKIGETLALIRQATPGRCNSRTILTAASSRSNYLHRFLEWDNEIAGDRYRLVQIRELVSAIDIIAGPEKKQMPAFVSLSEKGGRGYRTVGEILDSMSLMDIALSQAKRELEAIERRFMQFVDICSPLREAQQAIDARRQKAKRRSKPEDRPSA